MFYSQIGMKNDKEPIYEASGYFDLDVLTSDNVIEISPTLSLYNDKVGLISQ